MLLSLLELLQPWLQSVGLYRFLMVLDQLEFRVIASGLGAFFFVLVVGPRAIRWLAAKKIGDQARFDVEALDEALKSKSNTPTMGGLLIGAAILLATVLFGDLGLGAGHEVGGSYVRLAVVVVAWLGILGGFDDWLKLTASSRPGGSRQGLHAWEKLVFQLGLGALIGYFAFRAGEGTDGLAHAINLPFQKTYESPIGAVNDGVLYLPLWAYVAMMTVFMAGMSNAVNITDGMDGLASGVTIVVALGLVGLCLIAGDNDAARYLLVPYVATADQLAVVAAALAGACLGFLWFNASPASVFMGDTGSLLLGGLIGYLAVVLRQEFVVLVMSGVFMIEILSVVIQVGWFKWTKRRTGAGRRVFRCAPYHWHLHMGGWAETKVVIRCWVLSIVFVAVAYASMKLR